ncbi:MAG: hypothetical protein DDT23_01271 [candidate division WS2 bacterium]|nr:hypothetical protein [Candidatus Lithacetigena glycinireducens]
MPLPEITEDIINDLASGASLSKGYNYFHSGTVEKVWIEKGAYNAHVQGSELYTVTISRNKDDLQTDCTCPYDWGGVCKHIVAAMLAICHNKKIKEHKKDVVDIKFLIEKVDTGRLKKFLLEKLSTDSELLEDLKIFARGKEETGVSAKKYKDGILSQFKGLKGIEYYYDHYHDSYEHPVSEIVDSFTEIAEKYSAQENYKEAIKIYQGICDACTECLQDNKLEEHFDDIHYVAQEAFNSMAENIRNLSPLKDKKTYFDYLIRAYKAFEDKSVFKNVFLTAVNTSEEADYILNKSADDLIPPIKLNLSITKGDAEAVYSYGEKYYKEYLAMAIPLSEFYLKNKFRDKAIDTAEKAIEIIQSKRKDFRFHFGLSDDIEGLREFLDKCYTSESDYPKIIENLVMLLDLKRDIAYYQKLKKVIKTEQEKNSILERVEKLLSGDHELLFKIYSLENDYESMLKLAGNSVQFDIFHSIVKKIRDRYQEKCFELYKKKINQFTEDVKKRDAYKQAAYWLKLMKEIPETQDKFRKYIEHLREKYKRRHAFIEEIKGI